jgi:hypothetical protein
MSNFSNFRGGGGSTTRTVTRVVATDGQITFTVSYNIGYIDVYVNGSKLDASEYTASNATTVVLNEACSTGDIVELIAYQGISISQGQLNIADETTNASRFIILSDVSTGGISTAKVSSSKLTFNPSTGTLGTTSLDITGGPVFEKVNVVAGTANGTANIDVKNSNVWLFTTNSSATWIHNIRGDASTTLNSIMSIGESIVVTVISKQNSSSFYSNNITIDGSAVTEFWQGGSAPTAGLSISGYDAYTWTIMKTASATYTVISAQTRFG